MAANAKQSRLARELQQLLTDPLPGCRVQRVPDRPDQLVVLLTGDEDTPYAGGRFRLELLIPPRYPFEPPAMRFKTAILHPNIDSAGRICLDSLKPQPAGSWSPAMSLRGLLLQLRLLMRTPNPDDPLEAELARQFVTDRPAFERRAREWTLRHAAAAETGEPGDDLPDENDENASADAANDASASSKSAAAVSDGPTSAKQAKVAMSSTAENLL
ncbi:hypothetical protein BOX15_Mlig007030g2 [Macrostomum lignano]|uniref:UBC core domain-containing protein n=1 Tax=Macrostomum lignano TaxID=282301 RepID=A0A267GH56_9PLAT|nr:hypothetical protein BOX15_Mlig007030g2 [Macrostomum lignano]